MALVKCPECDNMISTKASACPHCGYPLTDEIVPPEVSEELSQSESDSFSSSGCLIQALSFLVPIIGIILGCSYISSKRDKEGKDLIALGIGGFLVAVVIMLAVILIENS